jgi:hypothetical protein
MERTSTQRQEVIRNTEVIARQSGHQRNQLPEALKCGRKAAESRQSRKGHRNY